MSTTQEFMDRYLRTWTEPDDAARRALIEQVWAQGGQMSVSSLGKTIEGAEAIDAHIAGVHAELIAGKGLRFRYDQAIESGDALLLRWSMTAPNDAVVGRGADLVFRTVEGKVERVYMFMGVE